MPTLWFSKDGKRPYTQQGPGTPISLDEVTAIFNKNRLRFCGTEAPSINPSQPSHSLKNVVIEVEDSEGINELLPKAGFYFVIGIKPSVAESKLHHYRTTT